MPRSRIIFSCGGEPPVTQQITIFQGVIFMYGLLADLVVTVHFVYVATVVIGQLLILLGILLHWQWIRNPWFRFIHLAMILLVAYEALRGITCPLTDLEYYLREEAGQNPQTGSFVARLARVVLFKPGDFEGILAVCDWIFAGLVVATFCIAPPRFRRRSTTPESPATVNGDLPANA
jgi:hypothetical protein